MKGLCSHGIKKCVPSPAVSSSTPLNLSKSTACSPPSTAASRKRQNRYNYQKSRNVTSTSDRTFDRVTCIQRCIEETSSQTKSDRQPGNIVQHFWCTHYRWDIRKLYSAENQQIDRSIKRARSRSSAQTLFFRQTKESIPRGPRAFPAFQSSFVN